MVPLACVAAAALLPARRMPSTLARARRAGARHRAAAGHDLVRRGPRHRRRRVHRLPPRRRAAGRRRAGAGPRQPRPARPPCRANLPTSTRRPSCVIGDLRDRRRRRPRAGGRRPGLPPRRGRRQRRVDGQRPQGDRRQPGRHRDAARGGDRTPRPSPPGGRRLLDGGLRRGRLPLRSARSSLAGAAARRAAPGRAVGAALPGLRPRARAGGHAEDAPLRPISVYGITKRDPEELALVLGEAYGFETVALRYLNVYGPRQALGNPYTGVAAIFAARLLNGRPPRVFEDGGQIRDLVHVSDVVARDPGGDGRPGRAGPRHQRLHRATRCGSPSWPRELAGALGSELEPEITGEFRAGDIRHCFADAAAARELLGFEARGRSTDGLPELVEWVARQTGRPSAATRPSDSCARAASSARSTNPLAVSRTRRPRRRPTPAAAWVPGARARTAARGPGAAVAAADGGGRCARLAVPRPRRDGRPGGRGTRGRGRPRRATPRRSGARRGRPSRSRVRPRRRRSRRAAGRATAGGSRRSTRS